jgi:hypothetical protein
MHISEDRISHLANRILDTLWKNDLADVSDERRSLLCVKDAVARYFEVGDEIDSAVRAKLASYRPPKTPGSREYDVLFQKFYQEELAKRKR